MTPNRDYKGRHREDVHFPTDIRWRQFIHEEDECPDGWHSVVVRFAARHPIVLPQAVKS